MSFFINREPGVVGGHTVADQDAANGEYQRILADLFGRQNAGIKLGLESITALLAQLGNPHKQGRFVLVAGTNGKGSTSALISQTLRAGGHRVGLFTSPHLLRFGERIRINGAAMLPADVIRHYNQIKAIESRLDRQPTFFECCTAMALCAFAEAKVDIAVLEVGLGGRLDATNVVDKILSVITPISMDHEHILGNNLAEIAFEKCGIVAQEGDVVVSQQHAEASEVINTVCARLNARISAPAIYTRDARGLRLEDGDENLLLQRFPPGRFQQQNLATAWMACRRLEQKGFDCGRTSFMQAAANFDWPGRYQWLRQVRVATGPAGSVKQPGVLLDGAHNAGGALALVEALENDRRVGTKPIHCVFSGLRDKPLEQIIAILEPVVEQFYLCPLTVRRARRPPELASLGSEGDVFLTVRQALETALAQAKVDGGMVLICGSLFLVAEALYLLTPGPRDPPVPF